MVACPSSAILLVHVLVFLVVLRFSVPAVVASGLAYPAAAFDPSYSVRTLVVAASQSSVDLELLSDVESRVEER